MMTLSSQIFIILMIFIGWTKAEVFKWFDSHLFKAIFIFIMASEAVTFLNQDCLPMIQFFKDSRVSNSFVQV